jgi:hypothetical protein
MTIKPNPPKDGDGHHKLALLLMSFERSLGIGE